MKPLDSKGRDDYFRRVADVQIAQIKAGTAPWVQSWEAGERVQPYNLKTGKTYRGGNATRLASVSEMHGYEDERWGTYRHAWIDEVAVGRDTPQLGSPGPKRQSCNMPPRFTGHRLGGTGLVAADGADSCGSAG